MKHINYTQPIFFLSKNWIFVFNIQSTMLININTTYTLTIGWKHKIMITMFIYSQVAIVSHNKIQYFSSTEDWYLTATLSPIWKFSAIYSPPLPHFISWSKSWNVSHSSTQLVSFNLTNCQGGTWIAYIQWKKTINKEIKELHMSTCN